MGADLVRLADSDGHILGASATPRPPRPPTCTASLRAITSTHASQVFSPIEACAKCFFTRSFQFLRIALWEGFRGTLLGVTRCTPYLSIRPASYVSLPKTQLVLYVDPLSEDSVGVSWPTQPFDFISNILQ